METSETTTLELEQIGGSKPWVAEITGRDPKYGLARSFLAGSRDYSRSNRPGTRGIYTTYVLEPGKVYEINDPHSWGKTCRYFARVAPDLSLAVITAAEALEVSHG